MYYTVHAFPQLTGSQGWLMFAQHIHRPYKHLEPCTFGAPIPANTTPPACADIWYRGGNGDLAVYLGAAEQHYRTRKHTVHELSYISLMEFSDNAVNGSITRYLRSFIKIKTT